MKKSALISVTYTIITSAVFLPLWLGTSYSQETVSDQGSSKQEAASDKEPSKQEAASDQGSPKEGWLVSQKKEDKGYDFSSYAPDKDIKYQFGGEASALDKPTYRKAEEMWVALDAVLPKAGVMLLKTSDTSFTIIRSDGLPIDFSVGNPVGNMNKQPFLTLKDAPRISSGEFMISVESLSKMLDTPYTYDVPTNTVSFAKTKTEDFSTFTVERPPEPPEEELPVPVEIKPLPPQDVREEPLPEKYKQDFSMKLDTNLSYLEDKFNHDRTRQVDWYLNGMAYDYKIDGHYRMKDFRTTDKQRFKQDGEYFSIYRDPVQMKFLDNYMALPQVRSQSQPYFGMEAIDYYEPFKSTIIAGKTDNTISGPVAIGAVRYYGQMYAVKQEYTDINNLFKVSGMVLWHETEAEEKNKSSTTNYPRRNLLYVFDSTTHLYPNLDLFYTQAVSNYMPDNKVNKRFIDGNWRVGAALTEDRYSFNTAFEHVGQQYVSIGIPSTYQDFQGWDFSTYFKFSPTWYTTLGGRLNKNNVERNPTSNTSFDRSVTFGTGFNLPWRQNLNLSYSLTDSITRGFMVDQSGNIYKDYRIDYSKSWRDLTLQLSYDRYLLTQTGTATGGTIADSYSMTLFQFIPDWNNSYIRYYQDMRKTKNITSPSYTTTVWDSDVGARWNLTQYLSGTGDLRITTTQREAFQDTALINLLLGFEVKTSPVTVWNFDYNLTTWDLYDPKNETTKHYTLLFKLRHLLDIAAPEKWGAARVIVFRDLNSNGVYDNSEPGIPNVRVNIINGRSAVTNARGIAMIKKIVPGDRKVKVDLSELPLEMAVRGDVPVSRVTIESLRTTTVEFPIVATAKIRGFVYVDVDKNGVYDKKTDEGVQNVRVYMMPSGKETSTFSDGSYSFEYVYPGDHEVCVDLETVSADYKISSPEKKKVSVKESATLDDVDFSFTTKPIEVQTFDNR